MSHRNTARCRQRWFRKRQSRGVVGRPRVLQGRSGGQAIVVARLGPRPHRPRGPHGPRLARQLLHVWPAGLLSGKQAHGFPSSPCPHRTLGRGRSGRAERERQTQMLVALSPGMAVSPLQHAALPESRAACGNWAAARVRFSSAMRDIAIHAASPQRLGSLWRLMR